MVIGHAVAGEAVDSLLAVLGAGRERPPGDLAQGLRGVAGAAALYAALIRVREEGPGAEGGRVGGPPPLVVDDDVALPAARR
jgi:hypothetical protein